MAFDGIMIAALRAELDARLVGGRIARVSQPEKDAVVLTVKKEKNSEKLLLSCSPGLPLAYLTEQSFANPASAPSFCMLLRKHLNGGQIVSVSQPGMERILDLAVTHRNELGDIEELHLIAELMGKYSNLIFCDAGGTILDAMRRVPSSVSSLREVLPGRPYFLPDALKKADPLSETEPSLKEALSASPLPLGKILTGRYAGLSFPAAEEIIFRASRASGLSSLESGRIASALSPEEADALSRAFLSAAEQIRSGRFAPAMICENGDPKDLSAIEMTGQLSAPDRSQRRFESPSALLEAYYAEKNAVERLRQRSADTRRAADTVYERTVKKLDLQRRQLRDTEDRDKYRLYGELITAYAHQIPDGAKEAELLNYYDGTQVRVPLRSDLSAMENANRFYARYSKQKRTFEALQGQIADTEQTLEHLDSIRAALDMASGETDLREIREEMARYGYLRKAAGKDGSRAGRKGGGKEKPALPLHYLTSEGFDLYVGKNNLQNEEVTFRIASGADWWFHIKGQPGSHVIVKSGGRELTDRAYEEAAAAAAWYSRARDSEKADVDYVQRRELRKVPGARPGFVIYHTNYSMTVTPSIAGLTEQRS